MKHAHGFWDWNGGWDDDEIVIPPKSKARNNKEDWKNSSKKLGDSNMQIYLTQEVNDFIDEVVARVNAEVGGVGYAYEDLPDNPGRIIVDDVFLIPQIVSGASVDFSKDAVAIAIERAVEDDRLSDLRFSWHSHGSLGVGWSGTDEGGINDYLTGGVPWLASMVVNRAGDTLARVDVQGVPLYDSSPSGSKLGRLKYNNVEVRVIDEDRTSGRAQAEIDKNVSFLQQVSTKWTGKSAGKATVAATSTLESDQQAIPLSALPKAGSGKWRFAGDGKYIPLDDKAKELAAEYIAKNPEQTAIVAPTQDDNTIVSVDMTDSVVVGDGGTFNITRIEFDALVEAGHDPTKMSDSEVITALVNIDLEGVVPV